MIIWRRSGVIILPEFKFLVKRIGMFFISWAFVIVVSLAWPILMITTYMATGKILEVYVNLKEEKW